MALSFLLHTCPLEHRSHALAHALLDSVWWAPIDHLHAMVPIHNLRGLQIVEPELIALHIGQEVVLLVPLVQRSVVPCSSTSTRVVAVHMVQTLAPTKGDHLS